MFVEEDLVDSRGANPNFSAKAYGLFVVHQR